MNNNSVPAEAVTIYNHALELSNNGHFQSAIDAYKKAIDIYPGFIEAYNNIGEIYSITGKSRMAMDTYTEALKISRNHKILLNIGVEYYNNKEYKTALTYFNESVSMNKNFPEGNFYTALSYYNLEDHKKAEKYFLKVISFDKKHLKANYLLSTIYYLRKDYVKALRHLENIKDICEDKIFINKYYGFCCYFLGRYEEAVDYLTSALKSQPNYKKYKKFLESLTFENRMKEIKDIDKEIKVLENRIMKEKTGIKEVTKLSMLYIFQGNNNKAEKLLLEAKEKIAS